MSGQNTPARMLKSSPGPSKQGPMKATLPISNVLKHNANSFKTKSPTVSPTIFWKNRASPEQVSGQRSPGASSFKACKSKNNESMRRTASLDTLYLKGQWPRDIFYWHSGTLQINKATQTEESDWVESRNKMHCISENDEKTEKIVVRPKARGSKDGSSRHGSPGEHTLNTSSQTLASCIVSPTFKSNPGAYSLKPLPKSSIRSSVEGLNQEIERIVLKTTHESHRNEDFPQVTPEGHRAPLAELLRANRARSVNTQTPQEFGSSCASSGDSQTSSPDQESPSKLGTSPHINKFLAREPPDGCEKVRLRSAGGEPSGGAQPAGRPPAGFQLRPSTGSAFQVLRPDQRAD